MFISRNQMKPPLVSISLLLVAACLCLHGASIQARAQQPQQQTAPLPSDERGRGINLYKQNETKGAINALRSAVKKQTDDADGLIKHIIVVHPLSNGLTEEAVRAARQIRFIPAQKDGHPVSQYIQIEYGFNLY